MSLGVGTRQTTRATADIRPKSCEWQKKSRKGVKDDTSDIGSEFSADSSSGSEFDRGVKPTNAE
jgi:hypothetical protein